MRPWYPDPDRPVTRISPPGCSARPVVEQGAGATAAGAETLAIAPLVLAASVIAARAEVSRSKPLICQVAIACPPCLPQPTDGSVEASLPHSAIRPTGLG